MNLSLIMMALGMFRFGMRRESYQSFTKSAPMRWSPVARAGRMPALQFNGPDTATVTLAGVIYPHFRGGLRQIDLMEAQARAGMPMMLVDGLGWIWDRHVITQVDQTKTVFMADGAPQKIEFSITLQSYGEDRA